MEGEKLYVILVNMPGGNNQVCTIVETPDGTGIRWVYNGVIRFEDLTLYTLEAAKEKIEEYKQRADRLLRLYSIICADSHAGFPKIEHGIDPDSWRVSKVRPGQWVIVESQEANPHSISRG